MVNLVKVRLITGPEDFHIIRQTPQGQGKWDNFVFFLDNSIDNIIYDFVVVYNDVSVSEEIKSRHKPIFITGEPSTNFIYNDKFLSQFDSIITSQGQISHPKKILSQQSLPWHYGIRKKSGLAHVTLDITENFESLSNSQNPKKKLLSVVTSTKKWSSGHRARLKFVEQAKKYFGDQLDVFGAGIRHVEDKKEIISEYKYHIVLENSIHKDYWTEKLADCYLGGAFPLYHGCPNISDYFETEAFVQIDINNCQNALSTIASVMNRNLYEDRVDHLKTAKNLVLNKYNLFPMIKDHLMTADCETNDPSKLLTIHPQNQFGVSFKEIVLNGKKKLNKFLYRS